MPKLPPTLEAYLRPEAAPVAPDIYDVIAKAETEATARGLGRLVWLAVLTASTMAVASPHSMRVLFNYTTASEPLSERIAVAEFMREIGLRCLGIHGIPRTINMLNSFLNSLPESVVSSLNTIPSRHVDASNIELVQDRGRALWDMVHGPFETILEHKLRRTHPDLPTIIINNEYGGLFADPEHTHGASIGRIVMTLSAIASLRAQPDAQPQLRSHIFGLRKAWEDGAWEDEPELGPKDAVQWLTSEEGCVWVLNQTDELAEALSGVQHGKSPLLKARL
ncbi:hypothetical protein GQ44DRAFT_784985 [Phaeosphaeriaceae sp. PMI808]|nr:hypothetical protein GQ44DRAFT_780080 [Phaeosphaeriaceae sp. PMI808]KAH8701422.1 hypothetical protein GQ44DRAFT_784985 [Phaeosphaeriaceae sp. PMI808]